MPELLFKELEKLPQVETVALGGSRTGEHCDEKSDYDVYVYCTEPPSETTRSKILSAYCSKTEIGNHFWEYEDNCTLKSGADIDIIYRNLDSFAEEISSVADKHIPRGGYTTCMLHNLLTCKITFDRNGRLAELKKRYSVPYPAELKKNITEYNMKLLKYAMPAYDGQIKKAVFRGDKVSINHRVTEFLASYFDVIFAVNEMTHPGEKRLIDICFKRCGILPADFKENLNSLFSHMFTETEKVSGDIDKIVSELEKII